MSVVNQNVSLPRYLKTGSNQYISISIIYNNLVSEISDTHPQLQALIGHDTTPYTFNVGKVPVLKKMF